MLYGEPRRHKGFAPRGPWPTLCKSADMKPAIFHPPAAPVPVAGF